jgi:hypothetical protein
VMSANDEYSAIATSTDQHATVKAGRRA